MKASQSLGSRRSICGDVEVWVESEKEIKRNVAEILTARDRNVNSGDALRCVLDVGWTRCWAAGRFLRYALRTSDTNFLSLIVVCSFFVRL